MPLDAICLGAVTNELNTVLTGCRIEKVYQPDRDEIVIQTRGQGGARRLLVSIAAGTPRVHFIETARENPAVPPMFCMLLRKHVQGAKIAAVTQPAVERMLSIELDTTDEMGVACKKHLICELMGKHSNVVLCGEDNRIIDAMRRVDGDLSGKRQVLPGLFYRLPARQNKRSPLTVTEEEFAALLSHAAPDAPLDGWLLDTFTALPPLVARELTARACGSTDAPASQGAALWTVFAQWRNAVNDSHFTPTLIKRNGALADFTYGPILQYGPAAETEVYDTFSHLLDDFYEKREQAERVRQKGQDLLKTATTARDRVRRKLAAQEKELSACLDRDRLRICGELITANLYRMERGQSRLTAQNYYDENCADMDIPLDVRLSPQENAARYFKQYAKAKTAEKYLTAQLQKGGEELQYLESVLQELSQAEAEQDFNDIRTELTDGGYIRQRGKKQSGFQRASRPREFRTSAGLRVLVGRSNRQNDRLTTKDADKRDLWLHTQKIHGSHVILCTGGAEPDEQSLLEAASLAAYFSQAQGSAKVPVDYTPVKFVKKPAGARPGMVVYTTYQTMLADPDESLVKRLAVK